MKFFRAAVLALLFLSSPALRSQSLNLITNGSFEIFNRGSPVGWSYGGLYIAYNAPSPDGNSHVGIASYLYQNIPTVVGQTYTIQFYARYSMPTVYFGFNTLSLNYSGSLSQFVLVQAVGVATHDLTLVNFVGSGFIDDVRVTPLYTPLVVVRQPESYAVYEGGNVAFSVRAEGGLPIFYRWNFNGVPIAGATNSHLLLTNLTTAQAGKYSVTMTNPIGSLTSSNGTLTVEPAPEAPLITLQPHGDVVPAGYAHTLSVFALGNQPLEYQWTRDDVEIPGGTNRALHFPSVQLSDAGTYTVRVRNHKGSNLSLPAYVSVTNLSGGGVVIFEHYNPYVPRPIYDDDAATLLAGSNFVAQLYAGPAPFPLRPVGSLRPFLTGSMSGFFANSTSTTVRLPDVPPGTKAYVQTRVWDSTAGVSYEDARARGGKFGSSSVFFVTAADPASAIVPKVTMTTFSLK